MLSDVRVGHKNCKVFLLLLSCQRIRSTVDEKEQKQLLMDLDVVMRSSDCPYIVQFYGALFREVWQTSYTFLTKEMRISPKVTSESLL